LIRDDPELWRCDFLTPILAVACRAVVPDVTPGRNAEMRAIFISYRREDSEGEAGRLFDDLVAVFGEDSVFMDVAAIEVGRDFRKAIDDSVATCGVLLAVVGKNWVDAKNTAGNRRLDDPSDFVRLETASALKRDIPVVPVLVRGATMPRPEELPDDLKELAYRNGVELTHPRWNSDVQLLVNALKPMVGEACGPGTEQKRPGSGPAAAVTPEPEVAPPRQPEPQRVVSVPPPPPPKKRSMGKVFGIIAAVIVAIIVIAIAVAPKQVTVPDLTGSTLEDASSKLAALHLAVGNKKREESSEAPNVVLSQSPRPNTSVDSGSSVDLVLSQESGVEVPPLVGESLPDARQSLADHQLHVGTIERKPKPGVPRNTVIQEFPVAGEKVKSGSGVDLMVSDAESAADNGDEQPPVRTKQAEKQAARESAPAANQNANQEANNAPAEPVKPREPEINLTGYWHDVQGVSYQTVQRGNNFTYTASGVGGMSRGTGVIRGLQFESTYTAAYTNGSRSSGRCAGTISPDGNTLKAACVDSMLGQTYNILSR
jgi:hypothetical protein